MKQIIINNPYIIFATLSSIILSIMHFILFIYVIPWGKSFHIVSAGLEMLAINIIVILTLNIAFVILKNKWKLFAKILSVIINVVIILFQIFMCVGIFAFNIIVTNSNY